MKKKEWGTDVLVPGTMRTPCIWIQAVSPSIESPTKGTNSSCGTTQLPLQITQFSQLLLCPLLEQNPAVSRHLGYIQYKQHIYKQEASTNPCMHSLPRAQTPCTELNKTCNKERRYSGISLSSQSQTSSNASLHWEKENWKFTVLLTLSSTPFTVQTLCNTQGGP